MTHMTRMSRAALPLALFAVVLLLPTVVAQDEAADRNTIAACEADAGDVPAFEVMCPVTVALHLREVGEGSTPEVLAYGYLGLVAVAIVVWTLVLLWRVLPRRFLKMKAQDKVAEVVPGSPATYLLTLTNRRKRRPADVEVSVSRPPDGWAASLAVEKELPSGFKELLGTEDEAMRVPLSARKRGANTAQIRVTVLPPGEADAEEWAELDVSAIPFVKDTPKVRRGKDARIVTLVKERISAPVIQKVNHEPRAFRVHDQVTSTIVVGNEGDGDAEVAIVLYVNDEEVGREDVTIPGGGEACIEMPWTVEEAENRVRVAIE